MDVFGFIKELSDSPWQLEEVTFQASPAEIRRVAQFLERVAERMEEAGDKFGHDHASDLISEWDSRCDVIVCRSK